ncbi:MAG: methyltransferase domain-containing protein [Myxococcales bacterium]|nr:SAM-dependent methyltransferase [Sorangiineae bacterium PRO1]MCL4748616.1 methyltransferase domain-containing protein [Myxococcales bacterium]
MSWLLAKIYDPFMRKTEESCLAEWRRSLLSPLSGEVLEIGAGTGVNLAHYGPDVQRLVVAEPDPHMRRSLSRRVAASSRAVELLDAGADALPADAAAFDYVVSTLVLCSVPDLEAALGEIHRVLRPGGRLVFIEHVAAEDRPERLAWQERLEPLWVRIASGCHLTRRTDRAIEQAGFGIEAIVRQSVRKALPFVRPSIRGVAVRP